LALDLRELENIEGTECYVVITNIESGDLWENPEFDPNNDTKPAFTPYYTCSAPDSAACFETADSAACSGFAAYFVP
jgi:hypothetical protein